jgi:aspartate racemase
MYIGVICGVGPFAGLYFHQKWLSATDHQKDQEHLPILLASVPHEINDRTEYLLDMNLTNPGYAISSQINK